MWETMVFGGTVIPAGTKSRPLCEPLLLLHVLDETTEGGRVYYTIDDAVAGKILTDLEMWVEGTPLPALAIPVHESVTESVPPSVSVQVSVPVSQCQRLCQFQG